MKGQSSIGNTRERLYIVHANGVVHVADIRWLADCNYIIILCIPGKGSIIDGSALVGHGDIVAVSINYRLGILGIQL